MKFCYLALVLGAAYAATEIKNELKQLRNMTKLLIIGSCVGVWQGLHGPNFTCGSLCSEFPEMQLEKIWLDGEFLTSGYLAVDEPSQQIVLMHRGTMTISNLFLDVDNDQIDLEFVDGRAPCPGCKVHQGFWRGYNSSFNEIMVPLNKLILKYPTYTVLIGGHSMGGSVAMLTAAHLKSKGYQNIKLITAGQPMVGNQQFADYIDSLFDFESETIQEQEIIVLIRQYDPVPFYPISSSYQSTSGEIFLKNDLFGKERFYKCNGQRDPECSWGSRYLTNIGMLASTHPAYGEGVYSACIGF